MKIKLLGLRLLLISKVVKHILIHVAGGFSKNNKGIKLAIIHIS